MKKHENYALDLSEYYVPAKNGKKSYLNFSVLDKWMLPVRDTVYAEKHPSLALLQGTEGYSFLMMMAAFHDLKGIDILLKDATPYHVNLQNNEGNTALHGACSQGLKNCPEYGQSIIRLLKAGADPTIKNNRGITPLMEMELSAGYEAFEMMVEKGADVNAETYYGDGKSFYKNTIGELVFGVEAQTDFYGRLESDGSENVELVKRIYELYKKNGLDPELGGEKRASIKSLEKNLATDRAEAAKDIPRIPEEEILGKKVGSFFLGLFALDDGFSMKKLKENIDHPLLYKQTDTGSTFLMSLLYRGKTDELDLFLSKAPEGYINLQDQEGNTALMTTLRNMVGSEMEEMTAYLLKKGIDPTIYNHDGETPLMLMYLSTGYKNYEKLVLAGVDVNAEYYLSEEKYYSSAVDQLYRVIKISLKYDSNKILEILTEAKKIFTLYQQAGLDPLLGHKKGATPYDLAKLIGDELAATSYKNQEMVAELYGQINYTLPGDEVMLGFDS